VINHFADMSTESGEAIRLSEDMITHTGTVLSGTAS